MSAALRGLVDEVLVHTGQHYDEALSEGQILATRLPRPDFNLAVGSLPREVQIEVAQARLSALIAVQQPQAVIVRGDTNSDALGCPGGAGAG